MDMRLRLYFDQFGQILVPLPPLEEQQSIVDSWKAATAELTSAVSRLECEIELLTEYRTRLTADVVTGKLDVREASKHLPDDVALDDRDIADLDIADDLDDDGGEDNPEADP